MDGAARGSKVSWPPQRSAEQVGRPQSWGSSHRGRGPAGGEGAVESELLREERGRSRGRGTAAQAPRSAGAGTTSRTPGAGGGPGPLASRRSTPEQAGGGKRC